MNWMKALIDDHIAHNAAPIPINVRIKQMQELRDDAQAAWDRGDFELTIHLDDSADYIEDELRELAYVNACESDSPNSLDFESVLNSELLKLGIES